MTPEGLAWHNRKGFSTRMIITKLLWGLAAFFSILLVVDMVKNPQSWRNIPLRFGDSCRSLYFWPGRLGDAYRYTARHSKSKPIPDYMSSWHLR